MRPRAILSPYLRNGHAMMTAVASTARPSHKDIATLPPGGRAQSLGWALAQSDKSPPGMAEVVADTRNDQTDDDPDHDAGEAEERAVRQSRRLELSAVALVRIEADECASRHGVPLDVLSSDASCGIRQSASSRFILSGIPDPCSWNVRSVTSCTQQGA